MNSRLQRLPIALVALAFALGTLASAHAAEHKGKAAAQAPAAKKAGPAKAAVGMGKRAPVLRTSSEMTWKQAPDGMGLQEAVLWGDPTAGPYGALDKFPAGTDLALHTHTHDVKGVVVSGTMVITPEGQQSRELGPGSYVFIPAGYKHTTSCKAGADCVVFITQPGKSDTKMVGAGAAKK